MAHFPISLVDILNEVNGSLSLLDQNFGLGMMSEDLVHPRGMIVGPLRAGYLRPWRHLAGRNSGTANMSLDKDGFKVNLDVQQFKPEEISVKIVGDCVVVEGNHEERMDEHGFVARQFKRRYVLPKEIEHEAVASSLSSDGVLTIQAPKKKPIALPDQNERVIQIVHTQQPAMNREPTSDPVAVENQNKNHNNMES